MTPDRGPGQAITVQAPNRIDLAGGTTDIYPLCLFMDGGFTVNVAVSVLSAVVIEAGLPHNGTADTAGRAGSATQREGSVDSLPHSPGIRLVSEDLGLTVDAAGLADLPLTGPLGMVGRVVRYLAPKSPFTVRTRNAAPRGSGLGASSALLVALLRGLFEFRNDRRDTDPASEGDSHWGIATRARNSDVAIPCDCPTTGPSGGATGLQGGTAGSSSSKGPGNADGHSVRGDRQSRRYLIDLAADLETACLGVPTGKQDYVAAAYGGFSAIEFGHGGFIRETLPLGSPVIEGIEKRVILAFTGANRFSGMNNWEVTKRYIDNVDGVRETLHGIRDVAREMRGALMAEQWDDVADLVRREWELRRKLAPGVTTEEIEQIMAAAISAGGSPRYTAGSKGGTAGSSSGVAAKVCGAGGGGCMIVIAPPGRREDVKHAMESAGASIMPFRVDMEGVAVR